MSSIRRILSNLSGGRLLIALVVLVGLVVAFGRMASTMFTEILWHAGTGYIDVFWKRIAWAWGGRLLAGLLVGGLIFVNLRVVANTLGGIQIKRRFGNLEISEQIPKAYVLWGMVGISALMALWFGAAVPTSVGIQTLLTLSAEPWGLVEPILNRDVGFYVFLLPVLGSVITYLMVVVFLVFTLATAGYAATGALQWGGGELSAQEVPRKHLGLLVASFLVLLALRLWLGRSLLLLDGSSAVQGIVGYTDVEARLPALQTMAIISALSAGGFLWGAWRNRGMPMVASGLAVVLAGIVIGQLYPGLVQRFRVEPNQLDRETPFIEENLRFTRIGFGLDALERNSFGYQPEERVDWEGAAQQFAGLPVWSRGALLTTYREVEARFPYYDFREVAIDRYPGPDGPVPLAVSVREIDPNGIQDPNWQNLHLRERYISGMGAVASLATTRTPEGRPPMLLSGIPPEVTGSGERVPDLALSRPQVLYGGSRQLYAVVSPEGGQFQAPDGGPGELGVDFPSGIRLSSIVRTLALAWRFRDANLLFAGEVTDQSRFVFRRSVLERVRAIAPRPLRLPEAPYPVLVDGRVVWIVEGFVGTRAFPLSSPHEVQFLQSVSYLRNSVKITVDAVTGEVDFYRVPVEDPLTDAYQRAFPGLIKDISEMPRELRSHIRYPKALMNLQAQALLQYHQETARAFHGQQDVWSIPQELAQGTSPVPYRPEYGLYRLPGDEEARFNLTTVFVPRGRQNLTAIFAARTDDRGVPDLTLYDVPVEDQVPGPRQVEALVEQDPVISQQFSLWRTGGSEVWTGHLHMVPVGGRLLYMEPVFLAAAADAIPELRRFVVSDGRRVAMTEELRQAIQILAGQELPETETTETTQAPDPSATPLPGGEWPAEALELLDQAEERLREGDWAGFGQALAELRSLLRTLGGEGGGGA